MACKMTPTPISPTCEMKGPAGDVQLKVVGTFGAVVFMSADYNGQELVTTPTDAITVPVVAGRKNLIAVYGFSAGASGRGELREVCAANTVLDDNIRGDNQAKIYRICSPTEEAATAAVRKAAKKTARKSTKRKQI